MKKLIIIMVIFISLTQLLAEESPNKLQIDENDYLTRLSKLLNQYETFMEKNGKKESGYYKAFLLFKDKLQSEETLFSLDTNNSNLIDDGARFKVNKETNEYYITIGYKLVDVFDNYPSLIFSIITHEIWHAYAYLTNKEGFMMQDEDPFEKNLYEFDAIINEAIFISEVLSETQLILSNYEKYLSSCYLKKSINDFTSPLLKVDYFTLNELYTTRNNYYVDNDKFKLDKSLGEIGTNLMKYYKESLTADDPWFTYTILIALKTYNQYSIILFKQTEGRENSEQTWDEIFTKYPMFQSLYTQISDITTKEKEYIENKYTGYIDHFNKDLL